MKRERLTVDNRGVKRVAAVAVRHGCSIAMAVRHGCSIAMAVRHGCSIAMAVRHGCSIGNCRRHCAPVMRHDSAAFESSDPRLRLCTVSTIFLQRYTGWRERLRLRLLAALHRCDKRRCIRRSCARCSVQRGLQQVVHVACESLGSR
jgi:hypothetical protein